MKKELEKIFNAGKSCHGIRATIDRFDDQFDEMTHDNSFNWCDDEYNYPIFEIRHDKKRGVYFVWIANDQHCDPRCDTYLDENCIMFLDEYDFYDFIDEIKTPTQDE